MRVLHLAICVVLQVPVFGTIDGGGQHREHERITRAAVSCAADQQRDGDCFEPRSIDQLAGHGKGFGAVGAPDRTEVEIPAAHCDDADFLEDGYPRTRDQATGNLRQCVDHLRGRFRDAVRLAGGLLDEQGAIRPAAVALNSDCELDVDGEQRSKCLTLESFGRALHGVQDFYSHSSWTDQADPGRAIGPDNPPGLNRPAPSRVLDLRGTGAPDVPADLSTGCFVLRDSVPGVGACEGRVTHAGLNKDNGLIDPVTGEATEPGTPRGQVGRNFQKAVTGAIVETRHQWRELQEALREEYGVSRASLMSCALSRDDPADDCRAAGSGSFTRTVILILSGVVLIAALVALTVRLRALARPIPGPPGRSGRRSGTRGT